MGILDLLIIMRINYLFDILIRIFHYSYYEYNFVSINKDLNRSFSLEVLIRCIPSYNLFELLYIYKLILKYLLFYSLFIYTHFII